MNEVWSMDFMHDPLSDGRSIRLFNVMDDFNRETVKVFTANLNRESGKIERERFVY